MYTPNAATSPTRKAAYEPKRSVLLVVLVCICCLLYGNTLWNDFAFDDGAAITGNLLVKQGFTAVPKLLTTPYHHGMMLANNDTAAINDLYRPLSLVSFAIEYQVAGAEPWIGHLGNVLFFAVGVALLFLFLLRLPGAAGTGTAFFAALLFAVHPIHTEVVANIKSRDELMCFAGAMAALLCFRHYAAKDNVRWLLGGCLALLFSFFAKETSLSFVALVPVLFFVVLRPGHVRSSIVTGATVAMAACYLAARYTVLHAYNAHHSAILDFIDNQLVSAPSFPERIGTAILILGHYLRLLVLPYPLSCDYSWSSIPFVSLGNVWVLLSAAAYAAILGLAIWASYKRRDLLLAGGLWFFLLTLAIFTNLFFLIGSHMAERFLFFPSVGVCLAFAALLQVWLGKTGRTLWSSPLGLRIGLVAVCIFYAGITIARNADWKNNYTLFRTDAATMPNNARLWHSLGYDLSTTQFALATTDAERSQLLTEAIGCMQRSVLLFPGYANAHYDLGNLFLKGGLYDSAEAHMQLAVAQDPRNHVIIAGLGYVYFCRQKYKEAIALCHHSLALNPRNPSTMDNLAICHLQARQFDSARAAAIRSLSINPTGPLALQNMIIACDSLGMADTAQKYRELAQRYADGK